ncbi:dixin-A isoform X2 [Syngnathoides biaculeatus]|uniref:dixin-A isoform X2 n=1 Tax=Syngnathoides biaculeatus TaxID=300417 RepID=UPI002ADE184D|nr:dixin-A isoform X2 [Syngnathoides biaculeatus]
MGAKQMKCLSSASPVRSPKEEYAVTRPSDTHGDETIRDQPEEQRGGPGHEEPELTHKNLAEETSLCGLCPSLAHEVREEAKSWEEQLDIHQEQLEKEMHEARRMVFCLQALLLDGSLPEDDQGGSVSLGDNRANGEQQLVLTRSRLDQSMEEALDLKRELLRHKQDVRHIQAIKDALQQRLSMQEDAVLQLKQELLRSNMAKEQLEGENAVLKDKLSERNKLLYEYEQLGRKDRMLQQLRHDEAQHKAHDGGHNRSDELQLVREALRSLRDNFSGHDPQHHTLDTLEQGVSSLMDRLHSSDAQRRQNRGEEFKSPHRRANSSDRDSWPQGSKMAHSHSSPGLDAAVSTKVLYFTDRSLTPFLINIPKRLGEVTLRDFKAAVDRQGSFRYHFKALDPEFGTVKEEVFQDGAVVPGWEGKIVAWVEEDHVERR